MSPDPGFCQRPFAVGSLIGLRSWMIGGAEDKPLQGLFHHQEWTPGVNISFCDTRPSLTPGCWQHHEEDAKAHIDSCYTSGACSGIELKCGCGFWAYTNGCNDYHQGMIGQGGLAHIAGIIQGYGRCVIGPKGFRAEKAVIKALILPGRLHHVPDPDVAKHLHRRIKASILRLYPGIPIFEKEEWAVAEYPLTSTKDDTEEENSDEQTVV